MRGYLRCTGAFYWARKFEEVGHQVKLLATDPELDIFDAAAGEFAHHGIAGARVDDVRAADAAEIDAELQALNDALLAEPRPTPRSFLP